MMEENKEVIQDEAKELEKKKSWKKWGTLLAIALVCGGGWFIYDSTKPKPVILEPTKPAITKETFDELPVGVIYEYSEEEKKEFIEYAKQKYNDFGSYPTMQSKLWTSEPSDFDKSFYEQRPDVARRSNQSPEEMLNDDFLLRYPDAFTGFTISSKKNNGDYYDWDVDSIRDVDINERVNQFLNVEEYYLIHNKGGGGYDFTADKKYPSCDNYAEAWDQFMDEYTLTSIIGNSGTPGFLTKRAYKSGLFNKENLNTNKIFELMYTATTAYPEAYELADLFRTGGHWLTPLISGLENVPSAYDVVDQLPEDVVVYFYPTKVWKVDNNTIVVDVQVDGCDCLGALDTNEIFMKIIQSNTNDELNAYKSTASIPTMTDDSYIVFMRLFNSDLTQGFLPDYGIGVANYSHTDAWGLPLLSKQEGFVYSYNQTAQNVLRQYYAKVNELFDANMPISTKQILTEVASNNGISYHDAVNIWATYYISHVYDRGVYDIVYASNFK